MSKRKLIYLVVLLTAVSALIYDKAVLRTTAPNSSKAESLLSKTPSRQQVTEIADEPEQSMPPTTGQATKGRADVDGMGILQEYSEKTSDIVTRLQRNIFTSLQLEPSSTIKSKEETQQIVDESFPYKIGGIMVGKVQSQVLIDGKVCHQGDIIGPWTLVGIQKTAIIVRQGELEKRLPIDPIFR